MLSIPAAPGAPQRTIFSIPEEISSASVSPDGKKFVYAARDQKSDVWLIDNFDPAYRKN
jgi:WD40 repeat protein